MSHIRNKTLFLINHPHWEKPPAPAGFKDHIIVDYDDWVVARKLPTMLAEVCCRAHLIFPVDDEQLKWWDEGLQGRRELLAEIIEILDMHESNEFTKRMLEVNRIDSEKLPNNNT